MKIVPFALCMALAAAPAFAQEMEPAAAEQDAMDGMGHMDHARMPHAKAAPETAPAQAAAGTQHAPFPAPTAAERAAAFPQEIEGMDMSMHMDDNPWIAVFHGDRLEQGEAGSSHWDLRAGIGRNFDKLWLRSEGEHADGRTSRHTTELAWAHATGPWWNRTIGLRHDAGKGGPSRDWVSIGVQGLAPYKIELQATAYVGASGRIAARLESEYELRLAHRLILQPRLEANAYGRGDPANRIGKGFSDAEFGLRLRYEFSPRFAPYVGHVWTRRFGGTADRLEAIGGDASEHGWVAGVRFWF